MSDISSLNLVLLIISVLVSGYFGGIVGMPLGPIRIFFMLFFGIDALITFGTNLAISFMMMLATVGNNLKNKRIDFKTGILFIVFGAILGPLVGGLVSEIFPQDILLLLVSIMILVSAILILRAVHFPSKKTFDESNTKKNIIASLLNFFIGALGAAVGMVNGALRYPIMINYLNMKAKPASATNSLINLMVSIFAFIGHITTSGFSGNSHFNLNVFLLLGTAGFIGSFFGSRHVGFYSNKLILKILYVLLFIMGILLLFREVI